MDSLGFYICILLIIVLAAQSALITKELLDFEKKISEFQKNQMEFVCAFFSAIESIEIEDKEDES